MTRTGFYAPSGVPKSCEPETYQLDLGTSGSDTIRFTNFHPSEIGGAEFELGGADSADFGLGAGTTGVLSPATGYYDLTVNRTGGSSGEHLVAYIDVLSTQGRYRVRLTAEVP